MDSGSIPDTSNCSIKEKCVLLSAFLILLVLYLLMGTVVYVCLKNRITPLQYLALIRGYLESMMESGIDLQKVLRDRIRFWWHAHVDMLALWLKLWVVVWVSIIGYMWLTGRVW